MELFKRDLITGNIEAESTHTVQNTIYTLDVINLVLLIKVA